ncbi:MAG TPA: two-component regulator propeller domain-containing protein [Verrucomicrobiae bacterium]|nr:two-component regulator propeller domain-containing protein [Verrucomicrobiae bacterium]
MLVSSAFQGRADDLGSELRDFALRTWSKADGLPDGAVTVIQQTQDGYLWVGTTAGLVRFDGVQFTEVPLGKGSPNRSVAITALCEDTSGCVWIGTEDQGIFSWQEGRLHHYGAADGLLDENVTSLTLDAAGRLWIGTKRGVNRRDGSQWMAFTTRDGLPDNSVSSVHAAKSGTVWITTAGGMCRFADGRISRFDFPTTGQERQEGFLGAYEDWRGNLWAFYATYLINLAEGNKRINYFPGEKSAMTRIWSLCEGRSGRLWIGASGRGVFCFDGTKFQPVTLNEGRWPNDVRTICEDSEGDLWLGLSDGVLAQLRPQRYALLTGTYGLPGGSATCLMADAQGRIYVGMDSGGLYASSGDRFEKVSEDTKWLGQDLVSSACAGSDASLWVATMGSGLYHIKDGRTVVYSTANGLSDDCVMAVCADAQGTIWAGTRAGKLQQFKDGKLATLTIADGLHESPITVLLPAREGGLWIGTENGALLRSSEPFQHVTAAKIDPRLSGKPILGLCEREDRALWIASAGGGLGCLTENRCLVWDAGEGFIDDVVSGVIEDAETNLWLATPRGLCRIDSHEVISALAGRGALKPKLLFEAVAGPNRGLNLGWPRAVRTGEGRLWFATVGGLVGIDTHGWETEKPAPKIHLEAVYVNNELTHLAAASPTTPVQFPADLHSLDFQVTALSFAAPEKIRFRHKLDGFDADWIETGLERRVRYKGLPSGPYTFHATACNADGVWNDHGVSMAFIIPTPLWRAPWALALYSLAAMTFAAGIVRLVSDRRLQRHMRSLEQQRAMERERMRIARNMHDEIGSKLTKISFLSERLKVESGQNGLAGDKVDSIATTSRDLLKALDEMVWAVNPRNDTLEQLASYLCHHASEYFHDTAVECDLRVQSELPSWNVSAEFRHNIFLAFEESLSNVLKHARATRVEVQIQFEQDTLHIRISDNGIGFASAARNGGGAGGGRSGLTNMRQHLADVGGSCVIQSQPGQGAKVELRVALNAVKPEAV